MTAQFWPDELSDSPYDDIGAHGRVVEEPEGLDVRCKVCHQPPGVHCVNPVTGKPRRNNVSCIGRVVRTAGQEKR